MSNHTKTAKKDRKATELAFARADHWARNPGTPYGAVPGGWAKASTHNKPSQGGPRG